MHPTQSNPPAQAPSATVVVRLCVGGHDERHIPRRRTAPQVLPNNAPLPRIGEVIYLSSTSAWGVELVIHDWRSADLLHIEVWITHVTGVARHSRHGLFARTQ